MESREQVEKKKGNEAGLFGLLVAGTRTGPFLQDIVVRMVVLAQQTVEVSRSVATATEGGQGFEKWHRKNKSKKEKKKRLRVGDEKADELGWNVIVDGVHDIHLAEISCSNEEGKKSDSKNGKEKEKRKKKREKRKRRKKG